MKDAVLVEEVLLAAVALISAFALTVTAVVQGAESQIALGSSTDHALDQQ